MNKHEKNKFFIFVYDCAILLEIKDAKKAAELIDDVNWRICFEDGLTPEQAVEKYKKFLEKKKAKSEQSKICCCF